MLLCQAFLLDGSKVCFSADLVDYIEETSTGCLVQLSGGKQLNLSTSYKAVLVGVKRAFDGDFDDVDEDEDKESGDE